mmetsp:Transcript_38848/g.108065  ORF Transcript_38848/g.108065 Transcript_38848/m.108065 type:complete len:423 (-) Transcript_38848:120-1388(-)
MSEDAKADKMVEHFLGITWGQLCPQLGFNHNLQPLLICEVISSFLIFHVLLAVARWVSSVFQPPEPRKASEAMPEQDSSLQELEKFSTMVDKTLTSMTQLESDALTSQQSTRASMESSCRGKQERPKDLQKLKDEFQKKIAAVKNKWQAEPEETSPSLLKTGANQTDDFHVTAALVVLYWALQAILSCMVLCSIGISMINIADGGVWPHYCLLLYAVSNSGILPTGCQAVVFLADWFYFEAITTLPVKDIVAMDPSYQPLSQPASSEPGRLGHSEAQKRQEEVADMKPKFVLLCLPELILMAFTVVTHTIPFMLMFLWLTVLLTFASYVILLLVRTGVKRYTAEPRLQVLRQAQVLTFLVYLLTALYIHTSVQVMTRVYAGEWRHGGYFDSLWLHLIIDAEKLAQCPWFSAVRVVDFPLRWT